MDPYKLFPPEVWEKIFANVVDPQDWLNLYRAYPSFGEHFAGELAPTLFLKVLPQVLGHLIERRRPSRERPEKGDFTRLLPLRLASRHCKKAVDAELESSRQDLTQWKYWFETGNSYRRRFEEFLDRFQHHPGNPIVGRSVYVEVDNEVMVDLVSRLVSKFGSQFRQLTITDFTRMNTDIGLVRRLIQVVGRTPNLEKLTFGAHDIAHRYGAVPHIENELMPVIPRLKSFSLFCFTRDRSYAMTLRNLLVRICCSNPDTLEQVDITGVPSELLNYPNLKSVKVFLCEERDLSRLAQSSWPLSKLSLERGRISQLFKVASHFKETLTSLDISPHYNIADDGAPEPDLPLLNYLQVKGVFSFSMLKNLSNLQVLRIHNEPAKDTVIADINAEVSRANAWDMLPNLRQIEVIYRGNNKVKMLRQDAC